MDWFTQIPANAVWGHNYTFVVNEGSHICSDCIFCSRREAEQAMYALLRKRHTSIRKVYEDHHDKTYICDNGLQIHINRQ